MFLLSNQYLEFVSYFPTVWCFLSCPHNVWSSQCPCQYKIHQKRRGERGKGESADNQIRLSRSFAQPLLRCAQAFIQVLPPPALPLPGFALKSTASIWNKLRFSFFSHPVKPMIHYTGLCSVELGGLLKVSFVHSAVKRLKSSSAPKELTS